MDETNYNEIINENINKNLISYLLNEDDVFSEVAFKVLQNQANNGLIKCNKVTQNGKIKLVYDTENYKSLNSILNDINRQSYISIISQIGKKIESVKENGFIYCENIEIDFDKIFIDTKDYSIHFICLPLNLKLKYKDEKHLMQRLKKSIDDTMERYQNLQNADLGNILSEKENQNNNFKEMKEENIFDSMQSIEEEESQEKNKIEDNINNAAKNYNMKSQKKNNRQKKISFKVSGSIILLLQLIVVGVVISTAFYMSEQATAIIAAALSIDVVVCAILAFLSSGSSRDEILSLVLINSDVKLHFLLNKPEFVMGKKPESVDGAVIHEKTVSKIHCKIITKNNKYYITDMESRNGTFVNHKKIEPGEMKAINRGDIIKLAKVEFIVR